YFPPFPTRRSSDLALPKVHFIRMISILMDNGIEEAVHSEAKILQLAFFEIEANQYFIVRNSSEHGTIDLEQLYDKSYSSKKGVRGYGLYALKKLLDQHHHVTLETSFEDSFFTQTLMMKK